MVEVGASVADSKVRSPAQNDEWWREGVIYQIYPRSFADADGDGTGDLAGIIEHLDHLAGAPDSLGVDAVWLSPIYPSPGLDVGYDVSDYDGIDPLFGDLETFDRLVAACHERGVAVILDMVFNHSSDLHPWFQTSRAGREGPFADWYIWRDPSGWTKTGRPRRPNNWLSWFGGPAWAWDEGRRQFYLHTFLPEQPDLNWRNPAVRAAMLDVVRRWLDRGVDGFRFDVFNLLFKDELLRSNPRAPGLTPFSRQLHRYDRNQPELDVLLEEIRAMVDERRGRMTVGELFDGSVFEAAAYTRAHHLVFDFRFILTPWEPTAIRAVLAERELAFDGTRWPTMVLSNHDQSRHASRYDDGRHGDATAKVAAAFELTIRGTPFLYYGEEIGMRDVAIPVAETMDGAAVGQGPNGPWWNRDQARTPMPWQPGPGAGFTTGVPWLRLGPDTDARNVAVQAADPDSILNWYRRLLALRRRLPVLRRGTYEALESPEDTLAYLRRDGKDVALVILAFGDRRIDVPLPAAEPRRWSVAASTHDAEAGNGHGERADLGPRYTLRPFEAVILVAEGGNAAATIS
jgi:alpha-glucosidase